MALTITRQPGTSGLGARHRAMFAAGDDVTMVSGTVAFDTSYTTGGLALTPANIGLKEIFLFLGDAGITANPGVGSVGNSAIWPKYDYTNQKLMAFGGTAATLCDYEIPNATNLAWLTIRFVAFGRK